MDAYCLMGNPVEHSKSPWIHGRFAALTGQPVEYTKRLVPLGGFEAAIEAFRAEGGCGCNVTVPFKFEAAALATETTERARLAGACNTLRFDGERLFADNTDGAGLVHDIQANAGVNLAGRDVLLIGAGGAGAGALGPLLAARPRRVRVLNRHVDKAAQLVQRHAHLAAAGGTDLSAGGLEAPQGAYDVVINATSSSLLGLPVPVPASVLRPGALAVDLMYGPKAEGFLTWAREHGAVPRDGLGMLIEQAAEAFFIWRGVRPPSATVMDEFRNGLV